DSRLCGSRPFTDSLLMYEGSKGSTTEGEIMKSTRTSSRLAALLIAALIIPFNISNRARVLAQDVEPQAAAGDLDTSFGNGGRVTASLPGVQTNCRALALQQDGKLLAAGYTTIGTDDFLLFRFNPDGSPDPNFGAAGAVRTNFFGSDSVAEAIAV